MTKILHENQLAAVSQMLKAVTDQHAVAGCVTLAWHQGNVIQFEAFGLRDVAKAEPMERDTLFRIASMTKPITSVATLMLIEEGKLRLEDPITKWLPEFSNMRVLRNPEGPLSDTFPAPRQITVEDLLTHRAGLAYSFSAQGELARAYDANVGDPIANAIAPDAWLAAIADLPLIYPPGQWMHYSHATDVLGFLLARIEGKTLGEVLRGRIFEPLGMNDTAFYVPPGKRHRMAEMYSASSDGLKALPNPVLDHAPAYEGGGGGLISTAQDYLKFARLLLGSGVMNGIRLLKEETVAQMTANWLTPAQRDATFLGLPFWDSMGFGLGVSTIMDPAKHASMGAGAAGSFGWPGAFGTWWQADPENDLILIYLIQDAMDLTADAVIAGAPPNPGRVATFHYQKMMYDMLA